jgi:hypothetical protein
MQIRPIPSTCILALLISLWAPTIWAGKTDVVQLLNGNRVTGEVKSLIFGSLEYSTDSMGTVKIDWEDVVSLESNQYLEVELTNGNKHYGGLNVADARAITIGSPGNLESFSMSNVVKITPIETGKRIFSRLEGSINLGFNTGKASAITQLNVNTSVRYRAEKYLVGVSLNAAVTNTKDEETVQRESWGINYQRFRKNRWFTDYFGSHEQNDELGIDSRILIGGGLGRYIIQNNRDQLSLLAGVTLTKESFTGSEASEINNEGKFSIDYLHRGRDPDTNIMFTTDIFPLLKAPSTFRAESNITFRKEVVEDLLFDISIFHSYLSNPTENAEKSDYGIVTSVGYPF